eukprot:2922597-Prymnesium_polylepis.2
MQHLTTPPPPLHIVSARGVCSLLRRRDRSSSSLGVECGALGVRCAACQVRPTRVLWFRNMVW